MSVPSLLSLGTQTPATGPRGAGAVTGIQGSGPVRNLLSPFGKCESKVIDLLAPGGTLQPSRKMSMGSGGLMQ